MNKIRFVGLDVHSRSIAIAVADEGGSAPENLAQIPNEMATLMKHLKRLGPLKNLRACYEAGPTGFGLSRALIAAGIHCVVVAPSLVPMKPGERVKTDKRDAVKLARFLRSGDLKGIHVPDADTEAMRDLSRAREDAKNAERVVRQQLMKFLMRNEIIYAGKTTWTDAHMSWIRRQTFPQAAKMKVLNDGIRAVELATERVKNLTHEMALLAETWSMAPYVKAFQAMRGVQMITAVALVAEIGNFERFKTATEFMSYLGLVPSEHSSGESTRRGGITRTGNKQVRRLLVESAWAYRLRPRMSPIIKKRNALVSNEVKDIAFKAQQRLHDRYARMTARSKTKQVTIITREMSGFIWAIARAEKLLAD